MQDIEKVEAILNHKFKQKTLIEQAFTHSSYINEYRIKNSEDNERLEFLGDAVLQIAMSEYIFHKYPKLSEGEMTKLRASVVCEPSLAKSARELNFGKYLQMGKGELHNGGNDRDSILADLYEAALGALYLDAGYQKAKDFVLKTLKNEVNTLEGLQWLADCKTHLQEQIQKNSTNPIEYTTINEQGPGHSKIFTVEVWHEGEKLGTGSGKSKKEAEQAAAREAIENYELF